MLKFSHLPTADILFTTDVAKIKKLFFIVNLNELLISENQLKT